MASESHKNKKCRISEVFMRKKSKIEPCLVECRSHVTQEVSKGTAHLYCISSEKKEENKPDRILNVQLNDKNICGIDQCKEEEDTYLGVLDKNTGKMKLVQMSSMCLRLVEDLSNKKNDETTKEEKLEVLATFGSTKEQKRHKKRIIMKSQVGSMDEVLGGTMNILQTTEDLNSVVDKDTSWKLLIPKRNDEAKSISKVYELGDIISDDYLVQFFEMAEAVVDGDLKDELYEDRSELFKLTIAHIKSCFLPRDTQIKKICAVFYMDSLIRFSKMRKSDLKTIYPIKECSELIQEKILEQFSTKSGNFRFKSPEQIDKIAAHILVLALILNEYTLDSAVLLKVIGLNEARLRTIVKVVGARYNRTQIILKFPLDKPVENRIRGGKKRPV